MSWQPLPTAVYCQSKRAVARRAVTCHSDTHQRGCGYTRHGYTLTVVSPASMTIHLLWSHLPVEEGGGVARHHEHIGRLDVAW
eukprot:scaffold11645_cov60-Phaeocystis_antarctica.AAC.8